MNGEPGRSGRTSFSVDDLWLSLPLLVIGLIGTRPAGDDQELSRYPDLPAFLLVAVAALSLVLRRARPEAGLVICGVAITTYLGLGYPFGPILLTVPVAVFAASSRLPLRRAIGYSAIFYLVTLTAATSRYFTAELDRQWIPALGWVVSWAAIVAGSVAVGSAVRVRRESAVDVREAAARRAVSEERLRMAQELHDSVGHGLAVIAMQAGVALHVLDRDPAQTREALEAIRATSRASLDGLREELDVLRGADNEAAPRRPAPGLADVDVLVERIRAGGVEVETRIDDLGRIRPEVDEAAYRILQESLTNVLRHSDSPVARVRISRSADIATIAIVDDGPARTDPHLPRSVGTGIRGMRARAEDLGGSLDAGPRPGGGFAVTATLPVPAGKVPTR